MKNETASPSRHSMRARHRAFDLFRKSYNEQRPHEALDGARPADVYVGSQKEFDDRKSRIEYPFDGDVVQTGCIADSSDRLHG
ncbi:MAG: hypothetical protein H6833_06860 [Planctomycetes bacterium]|nr:hypothetical protein [Planctomycetota bacterium]